MLKYKKPESTDTFSCIAQTITNMNHMLQTNKQNESPDTILYVGMLASKKKWRFEWFRSRAPSADDVAPPEADLTEMSSRFKQYSKNGPEATGHGRDGGKKNKRRPRNLWQTEEFSCLQDIERQETLANPERFMENQVTSKIDPRPIRPKIL